VEARSRTFTPWSHVVSLVYAHLSHAVGLNDVCDALQMNEASLSTLRGAVPPTRNNLSHSNKVRNADMAEALYWDMMKHLMDMVPGFAKGKVRRQRESIGSLSLSPIQNPTKNPAPEPDVPNPPPQESDRPSAPRHFYQHPASFSISLKP